jgi:hypothetical protein
MKLIGTDLGFHWHRHSVKCVDKNDTGYLRQGCTNQGLARLQNVVLGRIHLCFEILHWNCEQCEQLVKVQAVGEECEQCEQVKSVSSW